MDIERLKELKDYLRVANELSILNDDNLMQRIVDNNDVANTIDIAIELLNAEIARQSVKNEDNWKELREEFMHNLIGCDTVTVSLSGIGSTDYSTEDIHNMIAALTDNQPVAKSATSEEVQEAIEYFEDTLQFISGEPQEKDHRLAITALQEYQPWIPVSERMAIESDLRNGMVLAWSTELCEWQVENWGYVEDRPEDYTHWKPLPEPPKGE